MDVVNAETSPVVVVNKVDGAGVITTITTSVEDEPLLSVTTVV